MLAGKVAVVTGASEGLGKSTSNLLLQNGCKVVRIALPADGYLEINTDNELNIIGDLTNPDVRINLIQRTIEKFGTIDILVNNASIGIYAPSYETTFDEISKLYSLNVFVPNELVALTLPFLKEKDFATIVNIGSICGSVTVPWATHYCATKFAVSGMTQGLRRELYGTGINVLLVMPSVIKTKFREHVIRGKAPSKVSKDIHGVSPDYVAACIVKGIKTKKKNVYAPFILAYPFMKMQEYTPWLMDWYLRSKQ